MVCQYIHELHYIKKRISRYYDFMLTTNVNSVDRVKLLITTVL